MSERDLYFDGGERPDGFLARSIGYDTTLYREIAERKEQEGSEEAILAGVVLLEVADAVDRWFETHTDEPFGHTDLLLSFAETDVVAAAENDWYRIPGNSERQNKKWHEQYISRMSEAVTTLSKAGYITEGEASRYDWHFKLQASHPALVGEVGLGKALDAMHAYDTYGFDCDVDGEGLIVVKYDACPPSGNFEPVIKNLVTVVG